MMSSASLTPKETSDVLIQSAVKKTSYLIVERLLLSIMAGAYIALGAQGFIMAYDNIFLRAAVFPVGLMLIVLVGGELFTGNCLMTFGLMQKQIKFKDYISSLLQVLIGNLVGSVLVAAILYFGGVYDKPELAETIVKVANAKVSLTFAQIIMKGILCNILVTLAIWFATTSKDTIGKILGCWFPVMLFVFCGYEHCVANMFFLPMAAFVDPSITVAKMLHNIIPAIIGNYIGGGIIIPVIYHKVYYK